jgi:hypothetical protein
VRVFCSDIKSEIYLYIAQILSPCKLPYSKNFAVSSRKYFEILFM